MPLRFRASVMRRNVVWVTPASAGFGLELAQLGQHRSRIRLQRWPLADPCGLVALVVDFRVAADFAAVRLRLFERLRRYDCTGQAAAAQRLVYVDLADCRAFVRERYGKAGVSRFAGTPRSSCRRRERLRTTKGEDDRRQAVPPPQGRHGDRGRRRPDQPQPCRIKGAGKESAAERHIATVAQVDALAEAIGVRWRLMVYLGAYGPMRPEELAGLRCRDVDVDNLVLRVRVAEPERTNGKRAPGETESDAGVRTVVLPAFLHKEVKQHVAWFAEKGPDGLVFVGEKGAPFRRTSFGRK